jgi:hypothetical protein
MAVKIQIGGCMNEKMIFKWFSLILICVFGFSGLNLWKESFNVNRYQEIRLGIGDVMTVTGMIDTKTGRVWKMYYEDKIPAGFEELKVLSTGGIRNKRDF